MRAGRDIIARHGETVFNAAGRFQGEVPHTPLTRAGFAQADAIGRALRDLLGPRPALTLWASPTGRALQTLAVVVEHLELDWHAVRTDPRLGELDFGSWGGLTYAEIVAQAGPIVRADGLLPLPRWRDLPGDGDAAGQLDRRQRRTRRPVGRDARAVEPGVARAADRRRDRCRSGRAGRARPAAGSAVLVEYGGEQVVHRGTGAHRGGAA